MHALPISVDHVINLSTPPTTPDAMDALVSHFNVAAPGHAMSSSTSLTQTSLNGTAALFKNLYVLRMGSHFKFNITSTSHVHETESFDIAGENLSRDLSNACCTAVGIQICVWSVLIMNRVAFVPVLMSALRVCNVTFLLFILCVTRTILLIAGNAYRLSLMQSPNPTSPIDQPLHPITLRVTDKFGNHRAGVRVALHPVRQMPTGVVGASADITHAAKNGVQGSVLNGASFSAELTGVSTWTRIAPQSVQPW
jgi:hypothetical protein